MSKLTVEASPHIRSGNTTQSVMRDVVIALLPTLVAAVVIFGVNSLILTLVCVISCVVFEYLSRIIMKKPQTISDFSAVVTGILLALNLPPAIPLWVGALGSAIAAFVAMGEFENFDAASAAMVHERDRFEPDMNEHKLYSALYEEVYKEIFGKLNPLYGKVQDIYSRFN